MTRYGKKEKVYLRAFGARVRALRKAAGYSQEDFALEIGLDRHIWAVWSAGSAIWLCSILQKLRAGCKYQKVSFLPA